MDLRAFAVFKWSFFRLSPLTFRRPTGWTVSCRWTAGNTCQIERALPLVFSLYPPTTTQPWQFGTGSSQVGVGVPSRLTHWVKLAAALPTTARVPIYFYKLFLRFSSFQLAKDSGYEQFSGICELGTACVYMVHLKWHSRLGKLPASWALSRGKEHKSLWPSIQHWFGYIWWLRSVLEAKP